MILLAIDPGKTGALAWTTGANEPWYCPMPKTEQDLWTLLSGLHGQIQAMNGMFAIVEKVGNPMGAPERVMGNLSLREQLGGIRMALVALEIPLYKEVTPQTWMARVAPGHPKGHSNMNTRKNFIHNRVQQLYPAVLNHASNSLRPGPIPKYAADAFGILQWAENNCEPWKRNYEQGVGV